MAQQLFERVLKTIRNFEMLRPGDTVLVAVSGGPDSVFLLRSLLYLKKKLAIKAIAVATLDHGLRGAESREDSLFVARLARRAGVRVLRKRIAPGALRRAGISTEEWAREERYAFFKEAAAKAGANVIATGHTLDDQAETMVMRLVKGASLKGMAGIPPVRSDGAATVIRPLLELEKREICAYLDREEIGYRIDRTNDAPLYFRNVVRSEIIPFLEKYNPRVKRVLSNLAEHLREDLEFIRDAKAEVSKRALRSGRGHAEIPLKDIAVQPRALQKEILRDMLEAAGGDVKKLAFRHWKELANLLRAQRTGNAVDLPGGVRAERTKDRLVFRVL